MNQITLTLTVDTAEIAMRIIELASKKVHPIEEPTTAQASAPASAPVAQPVNTNVAPAAPPMQTTPAPVASPQTLAAPVAPVAPAPSYSFEDLGRAAAPLMAQGKQQQLIALLNSFGVQALTQLPPARYGEFATALRGIGAQI